MYIYADGIHIWVCSKQVMGYRDVYAYDSDGLTRHVDVVPIHMYKPCVELTLADIFMKLVSREHSYIGRVIRII